MANLHAYKTRERALRRTRELIEDGRNLYIIHYNCESLKKPDGTSPRVASISIRNFSTEESKLFSLHLVKERLFPQTPVQELTEQNMDVLERTLLAEYYQHLEQLKEANWIHWKMRDETYGFAAIAHRAHVLRVENIYEIPFRHRYDLSQITESIYGKGYTREDPHLPELVKLNNITSTDAVWNYRNDAQEVELFARREFRALQNSVLRKTSVLRQILQLIVTDKLDTDSKLENLLGSRVLAKFELYKNNPWFAVVTFVFAIIGFGMTILRIFSLVL